MKVGEVIKIVPKVKLFISESGSLRYELLRKLSMGRKPRLLLNRSNSKYFNHTARRVNRIMNQKKFSYLEIGVASGTTLQSIIADKKHGVDPLPLINIEKLPNGVTFSKITSDEYFASLDRNVEFDFIFLDGLHEIKQLLRDFFNSLNHVTIGGWILIDDIVPSDSISAISSIDESYRRRGVKQNEGYPWHGDCFKILQLILLNFPQVDSFLILYPDNPQLLLKINAKIDYRDFVNDVKIEQVLSQDYMEVFSSENLKKYPIYIEDVLMIELEKKGIISRRD
jgi:hypothetical protein